MSTLNATMMDREETPQIKAVASNVRDAGDDAVVANVQELRLFARAASGDRAALEEVWASNRRWIASVIAAHAPRSADVEDLLQDVAATFVAKCKDVRDAASLRGWLRVVAVNVARMAARSQAAETRAVRAVAHSSGDPVAKSASMHDAGRGASEMLALLERLPSQFAEPLLLQATQGLSQRQLAELLGVPETTVETRLARGRRMLRQLLQQFDSGELDRTDASDGVR
jgi:RNA polymerase sigma-70 factor (ECF subfamily)